MVMEKEVAVALMAEIQKLSAQLNVVICVVETIADETVRTVMRRHMAHMMMASDEHLYRPIVAVYPELDPLNSSAARADTRPSPQGHAAFDVYVAELRAILSGAGALSVPLSPGTT